ncbi:hypothetical protein I6N95_25245 [Vagococcus sp. BWB3-3]|uniref:Uncharacterized protein n=1 Tax=Vagococcus allomyrinae TaxID=2794353 RepID=A0A940PG99_9ENTE|nr:hypothetical protein [Vagococcus allomyrinae]MBP1044319.1 hypothetical protein [Vagococcus allomyrinae]
MFHINYKLFNQDQEKFKGESGYFQLIFNQSEYGVFLQHELEVFSVSVYQWFHDLLEAATLLKEQSPVFVKDPDVLSAWIELRKLDSEVISICEVHSGHLYGQEAVRCEELARPTYPRGSHNFVSIKLFNSELLEKVQQYVHQLKRLNSSDHPAVLALESLMTELEVSQINQAM